jgi:2-hydroxychromene-2-carboxylate isomerase
MVRDIERLAPKAYTFDSQKIFSPIGEADIKHGLKRQAAHAQARGDFGAPCRCS